MCVKRCRISLRLLISALIDTQIKAAACASLRVQTGENTAATPNNTDLTHCSQADAATSRQSSLLYAMAARNFRLTLSFLH